MAHAFLTVVANLKFPETYYLYTYYEFLFSSGLDLRYNDSVALLRLVFRAIFHPGLPAFTVLPDSSFFSFFFLFLSLSLSLPFSSSSLLNLRTSLKARWPRAKKLVEQVLDPTSQSGQSARRGNPRGIGMAWRGSPSRVWNCSD